MRIERWKSRERVYHGVLVLMYFHVSKGPLGAVGSGFDEFLKNLKHRQFAGNMKNRMTTRMAGVASFTLLQKKLKLKFFQIFHAVDLHGETKKFRPSGHESRRAEEEQENSREEQERDPLFVRRDRAEFLVALIDDIPCDSLAFLADVGFLSFGAVGSEQAHVQPLEVDPGEECEEQHSRNI